MAAEAPSFSHSLTFVSGNVGKIREVTEILSLHGIKVHSCKLDLPEVQGDLEAIARAKLDYACKHVDGAVLVEDSALGFDAMHGLPGPYIRHFLDKLGSTGLIQMLDGFKSKSATAECMFAYSDGSEDHNVTIASAKVAGVIVDQPRGKSGFGWDDILMPASTTQTFAEMSEEVKNACSHRRDALVALCKELKSDKPRKIVNLKCAACGLDIGTTTNDGVRCCHRNHMIWHIACLPKEDPDCANLKKRKKA